MSFLAKLKIDNETYNVLSADYEINQRIDEKRMPIGQPITGLINVMVESSTKSNLLSWATMKSVSKDGEIVFMKKDNNASMKTLKFIDGFCVRFREFFEAEGSIPMRISLSIAARKLEVSGVATEDDKWPGASNRKPSSPSGNRDDIHFSSFDSGSPSAHEASHVSQQRQGGGPIKSFDAT
jgi:hypothetical protein